MICTPCFDALTLALSQRAREFRAIARCVNACIKTIYISAKYL